MRETGERQHHITFVEDDELPEGLDYAFFEWHDETWLALRRTRLTAPVLEDAWATFMRMERAG